uniref:Uncharacterized protein n=1 Tax=Steinernema glaseri TaxID=37863 RepID=A0A1I8ARX8_9BILA
MESRRGSVREDSIRNGSASHDVPSTSARHKSRGSVASVLRPSDRGEIEFVETASGEERSRLSQIPRDRFVRKAKSPTSKRLTRFKWNPFSADERTLCCKKTREALSAAGSLMGAEDTKITRTARESGFSAWKKGVGREQQNFEERRSGPRRGPFEEGPENRDMGAALMNRWLAFKISKIAPNSPMSICITITTHGPVAQLYIDSFYFGLSFGFAYICAV